jgi:MoaA/NifB/PqqE/SkfB family radical SAM enzyme
MANDTLRGTALKIAEHRLYKALVEDHSGPEPRQCQVDGYYLLRNLFHSLDRALSSDRISPAARRSILKVLIGQHIIGSDARKKPFIETYGFEPPGFLTISPGKRCNLHCTGCYAASTGKDSERLDYDILSRIVREKTEFWDSHFTVISGGEPLMYNSRGKGLLDLAAEHPDNYFLFYTNGTLIGPDVASRLAELGNLTPAISVEGFEEETDARRGKGIYKRILRAFECLRQAGVPFGVSVTVTRKNAEAVFSDAFIDRYFEEEGAIYCWIFQYMPIGRSFTLDLLVTPEQRLKMLEHMTQIVKKRHVFIVDFWNSGPASGGCFAAGRSKGYFHIDWNGTVTPCVFFPYSTQNILDVYREGGDLNTVLMSPLFVSMRKWQREYSYMTPTEETKNQIVPCPIRDHHSTAVRFIRSCHAHPANDEAAKALDDEVYHNELSRYGEEVASKTERIWETEYLGKATKPSHADTH